MSTSAETMTMGDPDRAATRRKDPLAGLGFDESAPLLQVRDLQVEFHTREGVAHAVNGVDFEVHAGQTLGILGESGCGKSVTSQAIMGILDVPPAKIAGGQVILQGVDLLKLPESSRRQVRGNRIGMVFQDALSSLNPVFSVGWQLAEQFRMHWGYSKGDAKKEAARLLDLVGIPDAKNRVDDFPHQFSGGMRQRVMIAMALALDPVLLIADEPTTALDVTVQAQIMRLLEEMQQERNMGLILITHDMGVVADVADQICVMYAGKVVERADVVSIYDAPAHPYTKALLESIPRVDMKGTKLASIEGLPPNLTKLPPGCSFHPRCGYAKDVCRVDEPPLYEVAPGRRSACHFYEEVLSS
ncbi:MAG TPA: ABC transporter ATP-binding protein [Marmoricola sp.]|nr:ABC transporter ATP-binding protein [Marmoricola sp.]